MKEGADMKTLNNAPYKYKEICDAILLRIENGELTPGTRLPSARALGEEFGCNYHTVRRAAAHSLQRLRPM
jgi:DNA-binding GntR family transcriptional regulator